jgi:hypothetical protein
LTFPRTNLFTNIGDCKDKIVEILPQINALYYSLINRIDNYGEEPQMDPDYFSRRFFNRIKDSLAPRVGDLAISYVVISLIKKQIDTNIYTPINNSAISIEMNNLKNK